MEPTYYGGDLAVVYRFGSYEPGDVVAFNIPEGGIVIHRVVERSPDGLLIPQGDNRDRPDPWELTSSDIIGRAVLRLPSGGRALALLRQPWMLGLLAFGAVLTAGIPLRAKEPSAPTSSSDDDPDLIDDCSGHWPSEVDTLS